MISYLPIFGLSFVIAWLATHLSVPIAFKLGILDVPNEIKIHQVPTPRFGGMGFVIPILVLALAAGAMATLALGGFICIAVLGGLDDRFNLPPMVKLAGQIICGIFLGAGVLAKGGPVWVAVLAVLAVPLFANAINLLDGMDGLAAMFAILAFLGLAMIHLKSGLRPTLDMVCSGALLGFLVLNAPKAKTFMGDLGSLSLGYLLAHSISELPSTGDGTWMVGVMLVLLPIYDVVLGIYRRQRNGKPWFEGDRDHFYDQIHRHRQQPLLTLVIVAIISLAIMILALLPPWGSYAVGFGKIVIITMMAMFLSWRFKFHMGTPIGLPPAIKK